MSKIVLGLFGSLLLLSPALVSTAKAVETKSRTLESQLAEEGISALAKAAIENGDPTRGAIVYFKHEMACTRCHQPGMETVPLGPNLTELGKDTKTSYVVESLLQPSKVIKKGFETQKVLTKKGTVVSGLLVKETPKSVVLRDANGQAVTIAASDVLKRVQDTTSLMPQGLVNQLASRQEFLDLVRYLMEIARGGKLRAEELRPLASFVSQAPLPDYEMKLDHAGLIRDLNRKSFERGKVIYEQVCASCHGTKDKVGSMPAALRFASGQFKNGGDPYTMYQTVTRGYGLMVAQRWLVPKQKYDVIHYIREAFVKPHNPDQYKAVTGEYLASLPKGNTRGPEPRNLQPWVNMNYGRHLTATYQIGDQPNFAYKGIAVRLDGGPGGVSRGRSWMIFDHDTMRMAAAWTGEGFIDWRCIHFNGQHAIHPKTVGSLHFSNPPQPGWANPKDNGFEDVRLVGRDGRRYGPLPRQWAHYKGLYHFGDKVIVSYTVDKTKVLEMPGKIGTKGNPVFTRTFEVGPRQRDLVVHVATSPKSSTIGKVTAQRPDDSTTHGVVLGKAAKRERLDPKVPIRFDGGTQLVVAKPQAFDMHDKDYTIFAKIKTRKGGTIFSKAPAKGKWVPSAKTFFVRGGRLTFDVGWVGAVSSKKRVADNRWHDVAMTYRAKDGTVELYVDGKKDQTGRLRPEKRTKRHVVRIGFTTRDFPRGQTYFDGNIQAVQFYQRALSEASIRELTAEKQVKEGLVSSWAFEEQSGDSVRDASGNKHHAQVVRGQQDTDPTGLILAGTSSSLANPNWSTDKKGRLLLTLPEGKESLRFTLWFTRVSDREAAKATLASLPPQGAMALTPLTKGGPKHWQTVLKTKATLGKSEGPFAVDVLERPANNPWACRVRLSGLDFYPDGKRAAVCTWDGDVWLVTGVDHPENGLTWQRIASGMFQPLGLKIVDGKIYVCCRDQIVILHDLNGDGETDFYENFNNDHQVTDHFHEFAMGLQIDQEGNFYYARGARHALKAVVPHHGTLIKVSKDGSKTSIVARGFRAPNGVCLNPDGSFFVTDQEGHWTPKNRINWVVGKGGFFGNTYGYHNEEDTSDEAMEQPLCWLDQVADRSPAQLMWIRSKKWGPLNGSLLNLSYGYGQAFLVPHERIRTGMQGGVCPLPIPRFPTGVMRARFHPKNQELYMCGMFAWAGNQQQPGGLYRLRYTGEPVYLPLELKAKKTGLEITFSGKLDRDFVATTGNYTIKTWHIRRAASYGSPRLNQQFLKVKSAKLLKDGKTVFLEIPTIEPTRCMEIRYVLKGTDGRIVKNRIQNTIHELQE